MHQRRSDPVSEDAWILLNSHPDRNRRTLNTLLNIFHSPEKILGANEAELVRIPGVNRAFARTLLEMPGHFPLWEEKERMAETGARLITVRDPGYPSNLGSMASPPPLLYVIGDFIQEDRFSIAVIGSRRSTEYGRRICRRISGGLAENGITIVSGMARGIDTKAHESALRAGGRSIAVLGSGLSRCYPPENKTLMADLSQNGAVLSEYCMTMEPRKTNFPERNGIIAGLSLGVLIVEASRRSGSLITARAALEENRSVYAVPGDVFHENSEGTNALIRDGAQSVTCAGDILEDLKLVIRGMMNE